MNPPASELTRRCKGAPASCHQEDALAPHAMEAGLMELLALVTGLLLAGIGMLLLPFAVTTAGSGLAALGAPGGWPPPPSSHLQPVARPSAALRDER